MVRFLRFLPAGFLLAMLGCGHSFAPIAEEAQKPQDVLDLPDESETGSVQFFAFGDWGTGSSDQIAVADALADYCSSNACDFGLLLGDNFYDNGVSSVTDPQWEEKFEKVYSDPSLQIPFFAILGNHDHDGNEQAQIDYTALQGRWKMPGPSYRLRFPLGDDPPLMEIFVLDSAYGDAFPQEVLDGLASDLDASEARWKILALHHPIYSAGRHGDTIALKSTLVPVICHRVDAVLSGHDHLFAHMDDPDDGCNFHQWVIGTGGRSLYEVMPDPRTIYAENSSYGFGVLRIQAETLEVGFHRADGSVGDSYILSKSP